MNLIDTYPLFKASIDCIRSRYTNGALVEIGAGPHSTPIFRKIAVESGIVLHSVDKAASRLPSPSQHADLIKCHIMTGQEFLQNFEDTIFFCYMDNLDWLNYGELENPNPFYADCTKEKSEKAHLEQSEILITKMDPRGYILFDDTGVTLEKEVTSTYIMNNLDEIIFYGKGARAIPFLIKQGMEIIGYSANRHHGGFDGEHDQILLGFRHGTL